MTTPATRADCEALDERDPLADFREEFELPAGLVYLDGNSLGALPRTAGARVREVVEQEWGVGLISSWNTAGWFDKPRTLGDRLAPLIGAGPGEVVVCDSTSINLFKVVAAALQLRPGRRTIVSDGNNFPTDLYILQGVADALGGYERRLVSWEGPSLGDVLDDDVAVVVLTQVDYRTGRMYDMASVTAQVHAAGAIMVWDLAHSAGALPVHLDDCQADFAVGCTYKYLNGGPGSPAFVFAATRHQQDVRQPLSGWHGHADPFLFTPEYVPAPGISRFLCGTPHLVSYAALEASLDIWERVDLELVREKSRRLGDLFIALVERDCAGSDLELASPRDSAQRGSQVSLRHPSGYAVMQALIAHGVVGDFRAPDMLRFGFTPLYVGYTDVWDAVQVLRRVLDEGTWQAERYSRRSMVT
jgi:kynureninase